MNKLIMKFLDESDSFVNGFECGIIWQMVQSGERLVNYPVHNANKDQIEIILKEFGCTGKFEWLDQEWASLTMDVFVINK